MRQLRILLIGAHPDDCEVAAGGFATLMSQRGHVVRMLSLTDGGLGHYRLSREELILLRQAEALRAAELIGAESEVLAIPDGHLTADLANRERVVRAIRAFQPDLLVQVIRQGDGQFAHVDSFQCAGTLLGSNQSIPQSKRQSYHQNQRYFIANCI